MSGRDFDAFALPSAVEADAALELADASGVRLRGPDVTPAWLGGVADALHGSREWLVSRSAAELTRFLGTAGARFLENADPIRAEALTLLPPTARVSPEMAVAVLDGMARDWTEPKLVELLRREFGDDGTLDGFVDAGDERPARTTAVGPRLCTQIVAGSVPGVSVNALIRSLLVKAPTLVKPGRGDVVLPVLFARALREVEPRLADALAVVYWPGGGVEWDRAALERADVVTAYGSDETVSALRALCPVTTRFVAYHHRVSVGVVGREGLSGDTLARVAAEVAEAVALFDRRGCVSPQAVFLEADPSEAERFARALGGALARVEERLPSGPLDDAEASALHQLRGSAELLAASGRANVVHGGAAAWTVIMETGDASLRAAAGRTVRLQRVADVADVPGLLEPLRPHLQTVGVAGLGDRLEALARDLGRAGASRVVPFSAVPFPPPWWHHDGRGPLRDLVRWVDLEGYSS